MGLKGAHAVIASVRHKRVSITDVACVLSHTESQTPGNWEVPDADKSAQPRFSTLPPRTTKTKFIVDDKGYLKKEFKKPGVTAFSTTAQSTRPVHAQTKPRWPQENVSWPFAPRAGMPSKGIQTDYLPISTVPVQTYQAEGFRDFNFHH